LVYFGKISPVLTIENRISIYRSLIEPFFNYFCVVWDNINETLNNKLQTMQNRAARVITGAHYSVRSRDLLRQLKWKPLIEMRHEQKAIMLYKIAHDQVTNYLCDLFQKQHGSDFYSLRSSRYNLKLPKARTDYYRNSFSFTGADVWNTLPDTLKSVPTLSAFKRCIMSHHFSNNNIEK